MVITICAILHIREHPDLWVPVNGRKRVMKLLFIVFIFKGLWYNFRYGNFREHHECYSLFPYVSICRPCFLIHDYPFIYNFFYTRKSYRANVPAWTNTQNRHSLIQHIRIIFLSVFFRLYWFFGWIEFQNKFWLSIGSSSFWQNNFWNS